MFTRKSTDNAALDIVLNELALEMKTLSAETDEYATMVDHMERLHKLKNESSRRVSPDVMATIIANLAGIGIIVGYEHVHPVTSKALAFVMKLR